MSLAEPGFALHTMRYLPAHVPEINELPKRRVFHFGNTYHEAVLEKEMIQTAQLAMMDDEEHISGLEALANKIDRVDSQLTYGMLLVGGLTAVVNPLIGAGIAAKAVLPSSTGAINRHGLRPAGEKLSAKQWQRKSAQAEKQVLEQFADSSTLKVLNPVLQELDLALRTREDEHDPLTDPNLADDSIPELQGRYWQRLSEKAVFHVYEDVYADPKRHREARLGPEDIRWLTTLFAGMD